MTVPYSLHDSIGFLLSLSSRIHERRLEDKLKPLGLTRVSWCVLVAVGHEKLSKPSQIAAYVGIDRTAASRALGQLEAAGFVARTAGAGDRRTTRVALSGAGRDILARGTEAARASAQTLVEGLGAQDRDEIRRLLRIFSRNEGAPLRHI